MLGFTSHKEFSDRTGSNYCQTSMLPQSVTDSVVAVHTFQMAGLAKGYVIHRLKVGKHDGSTVRDGLSGDNAHSVGRVAQRCYSLETLQY